MKKILILLSIFLLTSCNQKSNEIYQKDKIVETVNKLFIETDNKNWKAVSDIFTQEVLFDMSSMTGSKATKIPSKDIINAWDKGLKGITHLHHQAGNYIVKLNGNEATVFCYGTATHYKKVSSGKNTRTFVGSYDFHLIEKNNAWKIDEFKFNLKYIDGNLKL